MSNLSLSDLSSQTFSIHRFSEHALTAAEDQLAVEAPLQILLSNEVIRQREIAITMRTPGADEELALGFLWVEGLLKDPGVVESVQSRTTEGNSLVEVKLKAGTSIDLDKSERHSFASSSCGVCGKTSMDSIFQTSAFAGLPSDLQVPASLVLSLPQKLLDAQAVFSRTGGLHAAALFSPEGELLILREDVGRHNALDKVIGAACLSQQLPLSKAILMLSGRISFELVQKADMAGIPLICAVGPPSTLAVSLARDKGITTIGFIRQGRFNCYSGKERIIGFAR